MSDSPSTAPAPAPTPTATPSPAPRRALFGRHPGLIALGLFVVAGVVLWLAGAFEGIFPKASSSPMGMFGGEATPMPKVEPKGLNINTASAEEMMKELGIKQEVADDIIARRPFKNFQQVLKVKGIGDKKLAKLKPKIRLY